MELSFEIVVARFAGYLSAAVLFGTPLFLIYTRCALPSAAVTRAWPWWAALVAAVTVLAATGAWVMLESAAMSGYLHAAVDPGALWSLLSDMPFGRAAVVRLVAAVLALLVLSIRQRPGLADWVAVTALGAIAVATLAWSGHGAAGEGFAEAGHLVADVLHLLAAATWAGALLALVILVVASVRSGAEPEVRAAESALAGFSGVGTALVGVLLLSGLVNGWFLIGPWHLSALVTSGYGRLLLAKLIAFGAMLCLAAANRFLLTPRLAASLKRSGSTKPAVQALRTSVITETALLVLVFAMVSWLGTLMPPTAAT